jgi:hypothetical protein
MGGTFSKKEPSPAEVQQQRQTRVDYQNYVQTIQTNVNTDVNKKALTPESGQSILLVIQQAMNWLKKNPDASTNQILANRDTTSAEITRILGTDKPKLQFKNVILALPTIADTMKQKKQLTAEQVTTLKQITEDTNKWFKSHSEQATTIDFSQEMIRFNDRITQSIKDANTVKQIQANLGAVKDKAESDVVSEVANQQANLKQVQATTIDYKEGGKTVVSVGVKTVLLLFLIGICLYSGSWAANFAIGRTYPYRILYFIFGCIPIYVPFVVGYLVYRRLVDGELHWFAFLPLTTYAPVSGNWIAEIAAKPFYWTPTDKSVLATDTFQTMLTSIKG